MLIKINQMFSTPVLFSIITKVNVASSMPIISESESPLKIWAGGLS